MFKKNSLDPNKIEGQSLSHTLVNSTLQFPAEHLLQEDGAGGDSLLNIYVPSLCVLRHDTFNLNLAFNAATFLSRMSQTEPLWQQIGYDYENNKDMEETENRCHGLLEKFMQLSKLKSWVST